MNENFIKVSMYLAKKLASRWLKTVFRYFYVSCCSMFWTNSRWLETVFSNFQDIDFDESL